MKYVNLKNGFFQLKLSNFYENLQNIHKILSLHLIPFEPIDKKLYEKHCSQLY